MGSVWKRCTHDGATRNTGLPARGSRNQIPACRCTGGAWYWRTDLPPDPATGRRRQASGHEATKTAAVAALTEAEAKIATGLRTDDRGATVAEWLTHWMATGRWKGLTRLNYQNDVDVYLIPRLGKLRLGDLHRRHVREMLAALADEGKSGHVIDKVRRTLRAALGVAVQDDRIPVNVAAGRFPEIPRRRRKTGTVLEVEQARTFISHVTDDPLHSLEVVAIFTGLRRGELLGLPWTQVSLTGDTPDDYPGLVVDQTVVALPGRHPCPYCPGHRGRVIQQTTDTQPGAKSEAGTGRWFPLTAECVDALTRHRDRQDEHRATLEDLYIDHGLVWPDDTGGPQRPDAVTKRHARLVAAAGIPQVTIKDLRKGAVSMLAASGMPMELIAILMGHVDAETGREHYLRGIRSVLARGVDDAARMLRGESGGTPG
jgi:integrase